jgi:hypothetical protein
MPTNFHVTFKNSYCIQITETGFAEYRSFRLLLGLSVHRFFENLSVYSLKRDPSTDTVPL